MAASMMHTGFARRKVIWLLQRKLDLHHVPIQRLCASVSNNENDKKDEVLSKSSLKYEDDYFGVSLPEERWSVPGKTALTTSGLFQKYVEGWIEDSTKSKISYVDMTYGTLRFDDMPDVNKHMRTRDKFHGEYNTDLQTDLYVNTNQEHTGKSLRSGEQYFSSVAKTFHEYSTTSKKNMPNVSRSQRLKKKSEIRVSQSQPKKVSRQYRALSECEGQMELMESDGVQIGQKTAAIGVNDDWALHREYMLSDHQTSDDINVSGSEPSRPKKTRDLSYSHTNDGDQVVKGENGFHGHDCSTDVNQLNFIDNQYFSSCVENEKQKKVMDDECSDLNLIDEQYFGQDSLTERRYASQVDQEFQENITAGDAIPELDTDLGVNFVHRDKSSKTVVGLESVSQSLRGGETLSRTQHVHLNDDATVATQKSDMNFIDQQFFEESKSILDKSIEPTTKSTDLREADKECSDLNIINSEYFSDVENERNPVHSVSDTEFDHLEDQYYKTEQIKDKISDFGIQNNHEKLNVAQSSPIPKKKRSEKRRQFSEEEIHDHQELLGRLEQDAVHARREQTKCDRWRMERGQESERREGSESAFDVVQNMRSEQGTNLEGGAPLRDSKGFKILKTQVPQLHKMTSDEIVSMISRHILYDSDDVVAIYKPYGLPTHGGPGVVVSVAHLKDQIARKLDNRLDTLHMVHRLDKETTGVMLMARTEEMASKLSMAFQRRQVIKKYWVVTKGIPNPAEGIIDIPMMEGSVDGKRRMVLKPVFLPDGKVATKSSLNTFQAETHYRVISANSNAAIVECRPLTGVKHQIRVHLAFGLNTPVLGDHKYSHLTKFAPQKLDSLMLRRLGVQQSKVRHVPMHLHAMSILIPEFLDGRNLFVTCNLPKHFCRNMRNLKLDPSGKSKRRISNASSSWGGL